MEEQLRNLRIMARTLTAGVSLFLGISIFLKFSGSVPFAAEMNPMIAYAGIIISLVSVPFSFFIYKKRSLQCSTITNENEKINLYRSSVIIQLALLEGPAIFNIIAYLIGGNILNPLVVVICILVMISQSPNEAKYNRFG